MNPKGPSRILATLVLTLTAAHRILPMKTLSTSLLCAAFAMASQSATASEQNWQSTLDLRYRLEIVDQDGFDRDATASTLRWRLGLRSPEWSGFSVGAMLHANRSVLSSSFNSTANGKTQYPVVADPNDENLSHAWVRYQAGEQLQATIGRQRIIEDNHRFIGNVGFRQLEQTFDAVTVELKPADGWQMDLRYLDKAHRVFGPDNPNPLLAEADLDAWMTTLTHAMDRATIAVYAHRLAFDDRSASHRNLGARLTGPLPGGNDLDYRIEYARQDGLRELSSVSGQNYLHLRLAQRLDGWHWFAGHERLEGDGEYAFQTPLATLHAHNGWSDQFLATPTDGLIDTYVAAGTRIGEWSGLIKLHDFRSDQGSRRYGNEYGAMISRPLLQNLSFEAKFAWFEGSRQRADVTKLWLTLAGSW